MIELITGLAPNIAGFTAKGRITKEDFDKVIFPTVKGVAESFDQINLLIVLATDVSNFSIGAWVQDAMLGLKHLTRWNRIAIVADSEAVEKATKIMDTVVPGEYKAFTLKEQTEAINWVSEDGTQTASSSAN